MTAINQWIRDQNGNNPVRGDSFAVRRTVTGVPTGDSIVKAWLTVKGSIADLDNAAVLQKVIASVGSPDGQITDNGANDGTGEVLFLILSTDYSLIVATRTYQYDIQVRTALGVVATLEFGAVVWQADVTLANS
jgi:hypothetical protein